MSVTIYEVKPSYESEFVWCMSGNKALMESYAKDLEGVVVERKIG